MEYQNLLKNWGLESFIPIFEEEGIDDETFRLLNNDQINHIFKKIGPILKFNREFELLLNTPSVEHSVLEPPARISPTQNLISEGSLEDISENHMDRKTILIEMDKELQKIFDESPSSSSFMMENDETEDETSINSSSLTPLGSTTPQTAIEGSRTFKRCDIFSDTLDNILNRSYDGRIILMHKKKLNNDLRQKLCKILVAELLKKHCEPLKTELRSSHFERAADEIAAYFPHEIKETYFIPYVSSKITGSRQRARGKLWSRYVNVKAALRVANQSIISNPNDSQFLMPQNLENDLIFLKSAVEPFQKVLTAWEKTFQFRKIQYKDCSLEKIFEDFPCLSTEYFFELIESDFNQMFEDHIDSIYSEWPKVSDAIIKEIIDRQIDVSHLKFDTSSKALLSLPYLFSPVTVKSKYKNRQNWRPTRLEIRESFVFVVENFEEFQEILERKRTKLKQYDIPLQPFATLNKEDNSYYIYFNEKQHKCGSAIRCLELMFKLFHSLNLKYPVESTQVWLLIEDLVFKLPTKQKNSATTAVIADLVSHL